MKLLLVFSFFLLAACSQGGARKAKEWPQELPGVCDTSAVIRAKDSSLILASDERNALLRFDQNSNLAQEIQPSLDELLKAAGLELEIDKDTLAARELDLEAVAVLKNGQSDVAFWIGSHGRRKAKTKNGKICKAKLRPNRRILFGTNIPVAGEPLVLSGKPIMSLSQALLNPPAALKKTLAPLVVAEKLWSNAGGWNIEGLAATPTKALLLGFRSPVNENKRALLLSVTNPTDMLKGAAPHLGFGAWLDLGKRGVRSLAWSALHKKWFILAGPIGSLDVSTLALTPQTGLARDFAIYSWEGPGNPAVKVKVKIPSLRPEAMIVTAQGFYLISDDGKHVRSDGQTCGKQMATQGKKHKDVFSRAVFVPLP